MASSTPTSVRSEDDDTVLFTTRSRDTSTLASGDDGASTTSSTDTPSHGAKFTADKDVFDRTDDYGDAGRA